MAETWTQDVRCQDCPAQGGAFPPPEGKLRAEPGQHPEETALRTAQGRPRHKARAPESGAQRAAEHIDRHKEGRARAEAGGGAVILSSNICLNDTMLDKHVLVGRPRGGR